MKILLFANTDWYLYNFRLSFAEFLRDAGFEVLMMSPNGPYAERISKMGFRWIEAPLRRRSLNPLSEVEFVFWLQKILRRESVQLIHGFTIKCAIYASVAAIMARVPARVCAVAGMGYVYSNQSLKAKLLRPIVNSMMRIAFSGQSVRLILQNSDDFHLFEREHIISRNKIRLIRGSGVDLSRFRYQERKDRGEPFCVLLAARLLWDKGIGEYVDAARIVRDSGASVNFILAGTPDPGNPGSVQESTLQNWSKEGIVEWVGHVEDMPALMANVDVMALPTTYGEGVPKSLIEGAACGLALIATDAPGCREIISHDVNGLLVPVRDSAALAEAIIRLYQDRELALRLGKAAYENSTKNFDVQMVNARTLDVYRELIDF